MQPLNGKPTRRGLRRASRGVSTGRRATRPVETTPGRRHERRAQDAAAARFFAARRVAEADRCGCCALSPDGHNDKPCILCGHTTIEGTNDDR